MIPSGTSYNEPSEKIPIETYSPYLEPKYQSCKWSFAALAAENTLEPFLAAMISAPLF